ncbi:MAG: pyridoxine 5'-phosphate synthase [Flavobacteriales bacterium]
MTKLSVNINKIATIRNARGGNLPSVTLAATRCEMFGADGITVHPRPDQRHITYNDVDELKKIVTTEFNVEGYPSSNFLALVKKTQPHQVTLVPDAPNVKTSNAGWDIYSNQSFLSDIISELKEYKIRTSIFVDPNLKQVESAKDTGTDRIELYTESYAENFLKDKKKAIAPYVECAELAKKIGLGINAGHDLSLENLNYFASSISFLDEVSIGHALISDALYLGLENTISLYKNALK